MGEQGKKNSIKDKKKDWILFEKLSFSYVKKIVLEKQMDATANKTMLLTPATHDGGYDAIWHLNIGESDQTYLMESKLRNSQSSLSLNDCAKAIIIAFNYPAEKLYITTNLTFSNQALENIQKMKMSTNLDIICINGIQLSLFVKENEKTLKESLGKEFIDQFINLKLKNNDLAILNQKTMHKDEIIIVGKKHQDYAKKILNSLKKTSKSILIVGAEGVGKSYILKHIKQNLENERIRVQNIDMNLETSPTTIFIRILENLWNVELLSLIIHTKKAELNKILSINQKEINQEIIKAVTYSLYVSERDYMDYADKYNSLLLNYLDNILNNRNLRLCFIFHNTEKASKEVQDFLYHLINVLTAKKIRIIIEYRIIGLTTNSLQKFERDSEIFLIENFELKDASNYIYNQIDKKMSLKTCEILAEQLNCNPLNITGAIEKLNNQENYFFNQIMFERKEIRVREIFLEKGFTNNSLFPSLVNELRKQKKGNILLELFLIFKGRIPIEVLNNLVQEDIQNLVKMSNLFHFDEAYLICHISLLPFIKNTTNVTLASCLAKKMLTIDYNYDYCVKLNILYAAHKFNEIPIFTLNYMKICKSENAFNMIVEIGIKCLDSVEVNDLDIKLEILLLFFESLLELHDLSDKYARYYSDLSKDIQKKSKYSEFYLRFILISWENNFNRGEFKLAKNSVFPYYRKLIRIKQSIKDYRGRIINAYGLTMKELDTGFKSLKLFRRFHFFFPKSYFISAAFYSQKGNIKLKENPKKAERYYDLLLKVVKERDYPEQQIIHARVDKAMCLLLNLIKNQNNQLVRKFQDYYEETIEIVDKTNVGMQEGRLYLYNGIFLIYRNEFENAKLYLQNAVKYLKEAQALIYMWRAEFTLISLLFNRNKNEYFIEIKEGLDNVTNILKNHFLNKIKKDIFSAAYLVMLNCCIYYNELGYVEIVNDILKFVDSEHLKENYYKLIHESNWKENFSSKVFCVNDIIVSVG